MNTDNNIDGPHRAETSRAATNRSVEYKEQRQEVEKNLSERYIAVQRRLNELETAKQRGAEAAAKHNSPALDELALLLHKANAVEIDKLKDEKEQIEETMESKGIDAKKYTVQ